MAKSKLRGCHACLKANRCISFFFIIEILDANGKMLCHFAPLYTSYCSKECLMTVCCYDTLIETAFAETLYKYYQNGRVSKYWFMRIRRDNEPCELIGMLEWFL